MVVSIFYVPPYRKSGGSGGGNDTNKGVTENHGSMNHETVIQKKMRKPSAHQGFLNVIQ